MVLWVYLFLYGQPDQGGFRVRNGGGSGVIDRFELDPIREISSRRKLDPLPC